MKIVGLEPWHWPQIPDEARPARTENTKGVIAVDDNGMVEAACIVDSWTYNACQIHIYIKNPMVLRHGFQQEVFNYIFNTAGREVVIGATPANNEKALKFIKNIGLEELTRIPDAYQPGVDLVITTLKKQNCRWIDQPTRLNVVK